MCAGRLDDFGSIPSTAFRAATVFMALSVVLVMLCLITMILFIFLHSSTVFNICAWLQTACGTNSFIIAFVYLIIVHFVRATGSCMLISVLVFPVGWDSNAVREVCGNDARSYGLGECGIRWAFILAMIGTIDCGVLAILAFILGSRYVKRLPPRYVPTGSLYRNDYNGAAFVDGMSRKGMPIMVLPNANLPTADHHEHYSEFSQRSVRSNKNGPTNGYASQFSINNFQL